MVIGSTRQFRPHLSGGEDHASVQVIVCHTCLRSFDECLKRCPELIGPDHPVFSAHRYRTSPSKNSSALNTSNKPGTMFNKSAAPISIPKAPVGQSRGNFVKRKEEVLDYIRSKRRR